MISEPRVLVVGAGPAGCAAAIRLAQAGAQVTMAWDGRSTKAMVETLAAHAKVCFKDLDVYSEVLATQASSPGVVSIWERADALESDSIWNPHGDGLLIERGLLDEQMRRKAEQLGVQLINPCAIKAVEWTHGTRNWQVQWKNRSTVQSSSFTWLIDATGRASWLARRLGAVREQRDGLVGLIGRIHEPPNRDHRLYLEAFSHGWLYLLHSLHSVVVGVMTDASLVPPNRRASQRWWYEQLKTSTFGCEVKADSVQQFSIVQAGSSRLRCPCGQRWLAVGDAAVAWDPLSSQGLAHSLASGIRAAAVVMGREADRLDYIAWYQAAWENYLESYQHYYRQVKRWQTSPFWLSRQSEH